MLAYAISLDMIAVNAAKDVRVLSTRADDAKQVTPPSKEVMRALIELADERFRVKLIFAAATHAHSGIASTFPVPIDCAAAPVFASIVSC